MESVDSGMVGKPSSAKQRAKKLKKERAVAAMCSSATFHLLSILYYPVVHIKPDELVVPDHPFRAMVDTESGPSNVRLDAQV